MPTVENLSKGFSVPAVASNVQTGCAVITVLPSGINTANSVQPVNSPTALAVPNIFSQIAALPTAADIPEPQIQATSYVGSVSDKSGNYRSFIQQGMANGDFYLSLNGATFKLDPLKYFLLQCAAYRTSMNQNGGITFATKDLTFKDKQQGEHYHCLILVFHEGRLVPAKAEFRTTKSNAATKMIPEIENSGDTDWVQKSDAHRIAAQCTVPWGRVVGTSVPGPTKNSGETGNAYIPAITTVRPAELSDMQLLFNEGNNADFTELFNTVKGEWEERKAFLDAKCGK